MTIAPYAQSNTPVNTLRFFLKNDAMPIGSTVTDVHDEA
jgi:hypothetical protein